MKRVYLRFSTSGYVDVPDDANLPGILEPFCDGDYPDIDFSSVEINDIDEAEVTKIRVYSATERKG